MAILRILDTGGSSIVELDGKTIGTGVQEIHYHRNSPMSATLKLTLDVAMFGFMPDGYFDDYAKRAGVQTEPLAEREEQPGAPVQVRKT